MAGKPRDLRQRVVESAEAVLERSGSVGPLELLQQIGFLEPVHVEGWRKGNPHLTLLEPRIQCGPKKLEDTYRFFADWVRERNLVPIEASYLRAGPRGSAELRITESGDVAAEQFFRTHFTPADLSAKKAQQLEKKLAKPPELVVYQKVGEVALCSECQVELDVGNLLCLENDEPLCLSCADLDHLEFLPSGDAALTRRSKKYSPLSAVVVRFNRRRKRYERQGLLVDPAAIARAEAECAEDADERAERREQDALRRHEQDREFVASLTEAIRARYPDCPADEARRIAEYTAIRGSGRVGRSAAARALNAAAVDLAVVASVRHNHTRYDQLLMQGVDRLTAREMIRDEIDKVLDRWSAE